MVTMVHPGLILVIWCVQLESTAIDFVNTDYVYYEPPVHVLWHKDSSF